MTNTISNGDPAGLPPAVERRRADGERALVSMQAAIKAERTSRASMGKLKATWVKQQLDLLRFGGLSPKKLAQQIRHLKEQLSQAVSLYDGDRADLPAQDRQQFLSEAKSHLTHMLALLKAARNRSRRQDDSDAIDDAEREINQLGMQLTQMIGQVDVVV